MRREFAVLGLGRFGTGVALALARHGSTVVGVDHEHDVVQELAEQLDDVVEADACDEDALRLIGISDFDTVVVAIGEFEANLLAVVAVRHLGARYMVAKALTPRQAEILLKIGVDEVVLPEQEAGERLASRLLAPNISRDLMEHTGILAGERQVPEHWVGKSLGHIHLRQRHGVLAIAIRRGTELLVAPGADDIFQIEDQVVLVGNEEQLRALGCHLPARST
jgi:trk system potassium uptake protein TrkA